ncbi:MAG: DUF805 domain-containing protein [Caldilineaceae bacterium]|nr:DUF805 domain-containing protein [Caldilineaceae bacterium]
MSIVQQLCPACAAPLPIQPGERRLKCVYCGADLTIERDGDEISVTLADEVIGKIDRLRLTQELHAAEMRLANVQSEIRSIQRGPSNGMSRTQLNQLHQEATKLQQQIASIKVQLDPNAEPVPVAQGGDTQPWSLKKLVWLLFTFNGRATRAEFWAGAAVTFGVWLVLLVLSAIVRAIPETGGGVAAAVRGLLSAILFVPMVAMLWTGIAVGVKRFHDRDKPGWWVLIGFIPVIGIFWIIYELGIQEGTPGPNQYG